METVTRVFDWYNTQCFLDETNSLEPWKSKILKFQMKKINNINKSLIEF
jgi:hypothetical protein